MIQKTIRLHRKHSAFVYAVLESLEGMTSYTTLPDEPGQAYRDLELHISPGFIGEIEQTLAGLRQKFPILDLSDKQPTDCL